MNAAAEPGPRAALVVQALQTYRTRPWRAIVPAWIFATFVVYLPGIANGIAALFTADTARGSSQTPLGHEQGMDWEEAITHQVSKSWGTTTTALVFTAALIALVLVMLRPKIGAVQLTLHRTSTSLMKGGMIGAAAAAFLVYFAAQILWGQTIGGIIHQGVDLGASSVIDGNVGGAVTDDRLLLAALGRSVAAGVGEEILLFAAPLMIARHYRWSMTTTLLTLIGLRWSIHLYYGWYASLQVLIWIPAMLVLYAAVRSVWPIIISHTLFDAVLAFQGHTAGGLGRAALIVALGLAAGLAYILGNALRLAGPRLLRAEQPDPETPHDAAATPV